MAQLLIQTYYVGAEQHIVEWDMSQIEDFCEVSGQPIATRLGRTQCNMHDLDADDCPRASRVPTECTHDPARFDPQAPRETPRCLDCGAEGRERSPGAPAAEEPDLGSPDDPS